MKAVSFLGSAKDSHTSSKWFFDVFSFLFEPLGFHHHDAVTFTTLGFRTRLPEFCDSRPATRGDVCCLTKKETSYIYLLALEGSPSPEPKRC